MLFFGFEQGKSDEEKAEKVFARAAWAELLFRRLLKQQKINFQFSAGRRFKSKSHFRRQKC